MAARGSRGDALNILLVEDHELFREGLKLLLADLGEALRFSEAANCAQALALVEKNEFDVVLLDFHLPGLHGFDALRLLRAKAESATIIVLSAEEDAELIRQIIDAGAAGFIPKASSHAVMMAALRLILAGGTYLPPHALNSTPLEAPAEIVVPSDSILSMLTERQMTTLRLAMQGKVNKVIAREMDVSEATVKAHLSAAFRVLGVRNRTEAVFVAARSGLRV